MIELIIPIFGAEPPQDLKQSLMRYSNDYLYDEDYKSCQMLTNTKFFGEPFACVDASFIFYSLENTGFTINNMDLISRHQTETHLSKPGVDIAIRSSTSGAVLSMVVKLKHDHFEKHDFEMILSIVESQHGTFSQLDRNGWITEDNIDIHVKDTHTTIEYAFINREAYSFF